MELKVFSFLSYKFNTISWIKKEARIHLDTGFRKTAATYSPTWWGSTIGDGELNFSVRNGKRWFLTAITAAYMT